MQHLTARFLALFAATALLAVGLAPVQAQTGGRGHTRGGGRNRPTRPVPPPPPPSDVEEFVNTAPTLGAHGLVYVGSWNHQILALDQKTGVVRWKFNTGDIINTSPTVGPDGTLYATSRDKNVYALDGLTGAKKWQYATSGGPLTTRVAVSAAGLVYVGTFDKKVVALDAKTGTKVWERATQIAPSTPILGRSNLVYVSANKLYALDGATGAIRWDLDLGVLQSEAPAAGPDGTVYVGTADGLVYALNGMTGQTVWQFSTGHSVDYPVVVGPEDLVYVSAQRLFALRASNGKERWEKGGGGSEWSAPAVGGNGTLYAGYNDANLYALDAATGRDRWQFATDDGLLCFPTVGSEGTVFFQCEGDGKVYGLNWESGRARWVTAQDPLPSAQPAGSQPASGAGGIEAGI